MPVTLFKHPSPRAGAVYLTAPYTMDAEAVTAYTDAEEAAHIRQIVSLALASVSPADFDRCSMDEVVDRTIRAMGSATTSKGSDTRNHADVERYDGIN